jgi:hypothetical protein
MSFQELISDLRRAESQLVQQLGGIRNAISSLEMGGAVSPALPSANGRGVRPSAAKPALKRRRMTAAARKAVGLRMKKYWAARRKAAAKAA